MQYVHFFMKIKAVRLCLFFIFFLWPSFVFAWSGKVVSVTDGDTIKVIHASKPVIILLYGIDTPEKKQAFGQKAKQFTADMVAGRVVEVEEVTVDRYGRTVGIVRKGTECLNEELVTAGFAWVYTRYCDKSICEGWQQLEHAARADRRGLWQDKNPIPPWEWRRIKRTK